MRISHCQVSLRSGMIQVYSCFVEVLYFIFFVCRKKKYISFSLCSNLECGTLYDSGFWMQ